jgi:hypothetical protein
VARNAEKDRKARLEEVRQQQASADRRRTLLVAAVAVVLVVGLAGAVTKVVVDQRAAQDITRVGVTASAAACDPVITEPASGSSVHVGPGTDQPTVTQVRYATVPPSSGEHFVQPEYPARSFYTASDRPALESLVHNLEHGYTVVWYTAATPQPQVDQLKRLADIARKDPNTGGKFVVSAWDDARGAFPAGRTVALSHWGAKNGYRQLCGAVSGSVVKSFTAAYPWRDAPEPNAA